MAEVGCLKDGHFQNLQVENTTILENLGDSITISSEDAARPLFILKGIDSTKDTSTEIRMIKDAADVQAGETLGLISFYGDDGNAATQSQSYANIIAEAANVDDNTESGKLSLQVASGGGEPAEALSISGSETAGETNSSQTLVTIPGSITIDGNLSVGASGGTLRSVGGLAPENSVGAVCNGIAVSADGVGIYEVLFEVDFGGSTGTATDRGLVKTAITIPTASMIIAASTIVTEISGQTGTMEMDLVSATTADTATPNNVVTADLTIIDGLAFTDSTGGAEGSHGQPIYATDTTHHIGSTSATATTLAWINKGVSNATTAITTGKILVYIKYMGTGPAVADRRV